MPNYELDESCDFPACPYCGGRRGCSHILLMVDLVFREGLYGRGYELFETLSTIPEEFQADEDLGDAVFEEAVEQFRNLADEETEEDFDGVPGQSTTLLYLYVRTEQRMVEILNSFSSASTKPVSDTNETDEESDDADEGDEATDESDMEDDESEDESGIPCPICRKLVNFPADERCKHVVAFSWDGFVEWFGIGEQLEQALDSLMDLVENGDSEELLARSTATPTFDAMLLASYLDGHTSLSDFIASLPQCAETHTIATSGMLGGCGQVFFSANISPVIDYCKAIRADNTLSNRIS